MPYKISESAQPLSRAAANGAMVLQASSSAYRTLSRELLLYCQGRINGRSFLISGHRGAGKTTLVAAVVQEARSRGSFGGILRPLLVPLNGTVLLPDPKPGPPPSATSWS